MGCINKSSYLIACCSVLCLAACSADKVINDGIDGNGEKNVKSVKFEVKTGWKNNESDKSRNISGENGIKDDLLLDAFIVKSVSSSDGGTEYTLLTDEEDEWTGSESTGYTLSKNLELGRYHFSMMMGVKRVATDEDGNSGKDCYIKTSDLPSTELTDFCILHPYSDNGLKECNALFLEEGTGEFSNEVNLSENSDGTAKHVFESKLTHAHARVDIMVIKANKNDNGYDIIDEDPLPNDGKISNISIELEKLNNACSLKDLTFFKKDGIPDSYSRTFQNKEFSDFVYNEYINDFNGENPFNGIESLKPLANGNFQNIRLLKGLYFFPSSGDSDIIDLNLTVNYKQNGTSGTPASKVVTEQITLNRNNVRLIVVWLINERFEVRPELDVTNELPDYEGGVTSGDEGFWN